MHHKHFFWDEKCFYFWHHSPSNGCECPLDDGCGMTVTSKLAGQVKQVNQRVPESSSTVSRLPTDLTNPTRQREIKRVHRNRQPLVSPDAPSTIFRSTFGACDPPRAVTVPDRVIRPSVSRPLVVSPCSLCTLNPLCLSQSYRYRSMTPIELLAMQAARWFPRLGHPLGSPSQALYE